jgi:hypothetical protein
VSAESGRSALQQALPSFSNPNKSIEVLEVKKL